MCFYDMSITLCFGNHIQLLQLLLRWKVIEEAKSAFAISGYLSGFIQLMVTQLFQNGDVSDF